MRIERQLLTLTILAVTAACGSTSDAAPAPAETAAPVAAAPAPAPAPEPVVAAPVINERRPGISLSVRWDSGPLDRDYRRERSELDALHARERAHPREDENADRRGRRQADESSRLELRYKRGKADHAHGMPPQ
jgi:Zn-finger nucleic acid-binding protein